ncbi:MAG: hypothetical protein FWC59_02010, partial [Actinomycetia bacterium]|nr:hypothetical protein [Actinomycetes bacterium]
MNNRRGAHASSRQTGGLGLLKKTLTVLLAVNVVLALAWPTGLYASQIIAPSEDLVEYGNQSTAPAADATTAPAATTPADNTTSPGDSTAPAYDSGAPAADNSTVAPDLSISGLLAAGIGIMPLAAPVGGVLDVNKPLGGGTIDAGDAGNIVVIGATIYNSYPGTSAGLDSATSFLRSAPAGDYVLYIGPTTAFALSNLTISNFASMTNVGTLVITGSGADPVPNPQTPATAANTSIGILGTGQDVSFSSNIILRNIRYNLGSGTADTDGIFMNGYDLTLGNQSWATAQTRYVGGGNTNNVTDPGDGTATMTVYSTGTGISTFIGGNSTGTMTGNTAININNTSGNTFDVFGAGFGTSATVTANLTGTATTTITGMATNAGGLRIFIGGVQFGNVAGKITNTISGPGRWGGTDTATSTTWSTTTNSFSGGSRNGNIGSAATAGQTIIENKVDTTAWTSGYGYYMGANFQAGIVIGNITNEVWAGQSGRGSFGGFVGGAGRGARITTNWSTAFNITVVTAAAQSVNSLTVDNVAAAFQAAKNASAFQMYGDITSRVYTGNISRTQYDDGGIRGAGWGYYEGNVYLELGVKGATSGYGVVSGGSGTPVTAFTYSSTANTAGFYSACDIIGGGGTISDNNDFAIIGDTTLVTNSIVAKYTYGGSFGGCQWGDSLRVLNGGIVDTCEGSGYNAYVHIGTSRAEVHGGQVDWFLSGGGWNDSYQVGNASVEVYDDPTIYINASMGGTYGASATHYIQGDSEITVHGGHFEGQANTLTGSVLRGFSTGPSNMGRIFGNSYMTLDFRGNKYGFSIESGDAVSGGRRLGASASVYLGGSSANTITVNVLSDANSNANLNGLSIYGDACTTNTDQTRDGKITINVNAPGADIGSLFGTNYNMITNNQLTKDVTVNLVSAGNIRGGINAAGPG